MSLSTRIKESNILTQQEKLTLGILDNRPMKTRQIIGCLMSEPYELTFHEVFDAMRGLQRKGLLTLHDFGGNELTFEIDAYVTFAMDWVNKL